MSAVNFTRRCALFENISFPGVALVYSQTHGDKDDAAGFGSNYVRVSDWVDVQFTPVQADKAQSVVQALTAQRREIEAKAAKEINEIDGRIIRAMATGDGR